MQTVQAGLFAPKPRGSAICLGTNGFIRNDGRGVLNSKDHDSYQFVAKTLFKGIEKTLGRELASQGRPIGRAGIDSLLGNHVALLWQQPLVLSFPTKWEFWNDSDLQLIERSCAELVRVVEGLHLRAAYLHPVGDGHDWHRDVRPIFKRYFDDRFIVCFGR